MAGKYTGIGLTVSWWNLKQVWEWLRKAGLALLQQEKNDNNQIWPGRNKPRQSILNERNTFLWNSWWMWQRLRNCQDQTTAEKDTLLEGVFFVSIACRLLCKSSVKFQMPLLRHGQNCPCQIWLLQIIINLLRFQQEGFWLIHLNVAWGCIQFSAKVLLRKESEGIQFISNFWDKRSEKGRSRKKSHHKDWRWNWQIAVEIILDVRDRDGGLPV